MNADEKLPRAPSQDDDGKKALRNALGQFATGVTIVTTRDRDGHPVGMTVNSFSSVSLDPPLVLWSVAETSLGFRAFMDTQNFAINILSTDQADLAWQFARSADDKFQGVSWSHGLDGIPLLEGCVAYFECMSEAQHPSGDHVVLIGRVSRFLNTARKPLLFHSGVFYELPDQAQGADKPDSLTDPAPHGRLWLTGD